MPDGVLRSINSTKVQLNVKLILLNTPRSQKAYGKISDGLAKYFGPENYRVTAPPKIL